MFFLGRLTDDSALAKSSQNESMVHDWNKLGSEGAPRVSEDFKWATWKFGAKFKGEIKINDILTMSHWRGTEQSVSSDLWRSSTEADVTAMAIRQTERFDADTGEEIGMWIFGYGSLCWNPGFRFEKSLTGFIRGFSRRFWQGNVTHRGTQKKPGRVATLVEEENGIVWGQAFQVKEKKAFSYLYHRECELGGYLTIITMFYPRQNAKEDIRKPFPVVLYLATPSNSLWLGDSPLSEIASQIVECTGNSGHNVEYLLRLATFVRENIPEAIDDHLFTLECLVRSEIKERKLCLKTLMGEMKAGTKDSEGEKSEYEGPERGRRDAFQFTSTVPSKKLRWVNI